MRERLRRCGAGQERDKLRRTAASSETSGLLSMEIWVRVDEPARGNRLGDSPTGTSRRDDGSVCAAAPCSPLPALEPPILFAPAALQYFAVAPLNAYATVLEGVATSASGADNTILNDNSHPHQSGKGRNVGSSLI